MSIDEEEPIAYIPEDMLSLNTSELKKTRESVNDLASRMLFVRDDLIRIVNKEGLDVLLSIGN